MIHEYEINNNFNIIYNAEVRSLIHILLELEELNKAQS